MSSLANWSYTAKATLWKLEGKNDDGMLTFSLPKVIACDYGADSQRHSFDIGQERTIKNVIWTECNEAELGDYILIGECDTTNPFIVGAEEIVHIQRFADTFERERDDFALITGGINGH